MAWRLHLTNRTIQQLDLLPGAPALLAAWSRRNRVTYYDLKTGVLVSETVLSAPEVDDRNSLTWQVFVNGLKAPNGRALPMVTTDHETIYLTDDANIRVYRGAQTDLFWQAPHGSDEIKLDVRAATAFRAVALDPLGDVLTALDSKGKLHVYRKTKRLGAYDLGLKLKDDIRPNLAIMRGGERVFIADNAQIALANQAGKLIQRVTTYYNIGRMACSPNGQYLAVSDLESGVVRVYDGATLKQTHQRFAIDLLA
ncbi:MAG: hypothetical protein H7Y11_06430, partial [Armatimonadetes bacterium]|nr:hypothetical protein [Anaerolineae bacterium]